MKRLYWLAIILGIVPLAAGVGIFIAWVVFRSQWLELAGVWTLIVHFFCILAGILFWGIYTGVSLKRGLVERRRLLWQGVGVAGLYLLNFVIVAGVVYAADAIKTRYTVIIENQSTTELKAAEIQGGGIFVQCGDIAAGKTVRYSFWIKQEGELRLTGSLGSKKINTIIDGYVTGGIGREMSVEILENGTVEIDNGAGRIDNPPSGGRGD